MSLESLIYDIFFEKKVWSQWDFILPILKKTIFSEHHAHQFLSRIIALLEKNVENSKNTKHA